MKLVVVLCSIFVFQAQGFLFRRREQEPRDDTRTLSPERDITEECLRYADWGHCEFYDCLESRFPCGRDGQTLNISKHFCDRIDNAYSTFNELGRFWLNRTSICLISYMKVIYQEESTSCQHITSKSTEAILDCNARTYNHASHDGELAFCDFISTNMRQYNKLMGVTEIRRLLRMDSSIRETMLQEAISCGMHNLQDRLSRHWEQLSNFSHRITNTIRSWITG